MLATKISFINEIANLSEKLGADVESVRLGIGSDPRIGYSFIYPGCGYGGSCFPKDVRALYQTAQDAGYDCRLLKAVQEINEKQKHILASKVLKRFNHNIENLKFAIWVLSFRRTRSSQGSTLAICRLSRIVRCPSLSPSCRAAYSWSFANAVSRSSLNASDSRTV